MTTALGRAAWAAMGGASSALDLVQVARPPVVLPSRLDVAGMLTDSVALATLALHQIQVARGQRATCAPVHVDGRRVTTSARSERHFTLDGARPQVWAPLSGFWQTADGWVRTHGNYPHHAERLAALLGVDPSSTTDRVAAAIARWRTLPLEEEAAAEGAVVGAVRSPAEWAAHAQALAIATTPLVEMQHVAGAPARGWADGAQGPLSGIRVLDLTRVLAGPVATRNLALAGADVLRIDPPGCPEIDWVHLDTGAGKASTALDLTSTAGRRDLDRLLGRADVVVTGYRPGALDRFGLSPDELTARKNGLVVAGVSAWTTHGPWAARRGFDSIVQAVTGIAHVESPDGVAPGALSAQALDHSAGHLLTAAVCRALLRQREAGGSCLTQVALATLARDLLDLPGDPAAAPPPEPTLQSGDTAAGRITCAAPALTFAGAPSEYPALATPWGADPPDWR